MIGIDRWQEIFGVLRRNKLRTFLTSLSVSWGIFMLVILLGAGTGLENAVKYKFRDDAVNSIWIWSGKTTKPYAGLPIGRNIRFTNDDYEAIKRSIPEIDHITSRYYLRGDAYVVRYGDRTSSFDIRATHPDHRYLENTIMVKGRFLDDRDQAERRKVTVIGQKVADFLFRGDDPVGKRLTIGGISYLVIGVFEDEGGENEMRKMYIPISTAQQAYGGGDTVHTIMFTLANTDLAGSKKIEKQVRQILATRHKYDPTDKRAIRLRNQFEGPAEVEQIFSMIRVFIWVVGIGTIVAGIVGVSNIMLISVKERTREIGLRKAVGATPGSLIALVMQESVFLTSLAGYCGVVFGVLCLEVMDRILPKNEYFMNPQVDLTVVLGATVLLVLFGALAGFVPARRAARVNPIVALREE